MGTWNAKSDKSPDSGLQADSSYDHLTQPTHRAIYYINYKISNKKREDEREKTFVFFLPAVPIFKRGYFK